MKRDSETQAVEAQPADAPSQKDAKRPRTADDNAPAGDAPEEQEEDDHYSEFTEDEGSNSDAAFKVRPGTRRNSAGSGERQLPEAVLEEGRVTFLYKPKVQLEHAKSIDDVQRFHMLLEPFRENLPAISKAAGVPEEQLLAQPTEQAEHKPAEGTEDEQQPKEQQPQKEQQQQQHVGARMITIGKKRLPDVNRHDRFFAYISAVGSSADELTKELGESKYATKTRGERLQPAARVAGSGVYCICTHKGQQSVLAYELELPKQPGEVQQELGIEDQGALIISVKNPELKQESKSRSQGLPSAGPMPQYNAAEAGLFQGRRWIGAVDPLMLDKKGTELLLIGARKELGKVGQGEEASKALEQLQEQHMKEAAAAGAQASSGKEEKQGGKQQAAAGDASRETEALVRELTEHTGTAPQVGPPVTSGEWD